MSSYYNYGRKWISSIKDSSEVTEVMAKVLEVVLEEEALTSSHLAELRGCLFF